MKRQRRRAGERGSNVIEAALTLPLFLLFVFSIVDFGWTLFLHQTLLNQASAGARYGAAHPGDLDAVKSVVMYNKTSGSGDGVLGLQPSNITVTRDGAGTPADHLTVTIANYQYLRISPGFSGKFAAGVIRISMPIEN